MTAALTIPLVGQSAARLAAARARLHTAARINYPQSGSPIACLMLERMGIDPRTVTHGPLTKRGYLTYSFTPSGKKVIRDGETVKIQHYWTREQKELLRDYWPLLERGAKGRRR